MQLFTLRSSRRTVQFHYNESVITVVVNSHWDFRQPLNLVPYQDRLSVDFVSHRRYLALAYSFILLEGNHINLPYAHTVRLPLEAGDAISLSGQNQTSLSIRQPSEDNSTKAISFAISFFNGQPLIKPAPAAEGISLIGRDLCKSGIYKAQYCELALSQGVTFLQQVCIYYAFSTVVFCPYDRKPYAIRVLDYLPRLT